MKKIKYIIFSIFALFAFNNKVFAGASLSTNKSQVTVGSSFTVTASISGAAAWNVHVSASGPVKGCSINVADSTADAKNTSKSFSATCTATGAGTITVSLSGDITNEAGGNSSIGGSRTVSVVAKSTTPTPTPVKKDNRSGNNNLKSLSVEGYEISPKFDSSKKEYTLNLTYDVTKIKIKAEKEHNKASISGTGEKEVKVGDNEFKITVTAENGNTKTYKLKVIVESKPIKVTIDDKEYTVIKKKEELPELKIQHEDMTLNFEEQDVPAYRIDKIGYILVGLRDSENNINLYKYVSYKDNEKPDEYYLFNYLKSDENYIVNLDFPISKVPRGYKKYEEEINGIKVSVYKLKETSKYSLIYGTNILTGNTNIYKYNSDENTIQLFEREEAEQLEELIENGKKLILILGGVILFLIILITIGFSRKPKSKKVKEVKKNDLTDEDIKKIEKDTSKSNKKELKRQKKEEKRRQRKGEPEL